MSGTLGHAAVSSLYAGAAEAVNSGGDLLIDASSVQHIHASVAQILLALCGAVRNAGRQVRLEGDAQAIRSALESGGLWQHLPAASA